jgi:spermidine synthase
MTQQFYKEITPAGFGIAIKRKEVLFSEQSEFQKVEIIEKSLPLTA